MQVKLNCKRIIWISGLVSLIVWAGISWPLPRHVTRGIPSAAHRAAADVSAMTPGDNLQFLYYCNLAADMLAGRTPWFYNLYEFNAGNDQERFEPYAYYAPFSLVHALCAALAGMAFGWNLTGFLSIWLTLFFTWLLARRWIPFGPDREWLAAAASLVAILLPYRWIHLFGGSPSGLAMAWIPAIWLGVDMATRENRIAGGILAGVAVLMAAWGDQHVFFFGTLAIPAWALLGLLAHPDFQWRHWRTHARVILALLPVILFVGLALLFPVFMNALYCKATGLEPVEHAVGPRSWWEVLNFSPDWQGFFGYGKHMAADQLYVGFVLPTLVLLGGMALFCANWRRPSSESKLAKIRLASLFFLLLLGMLLCAVLALGPRAPLKGICFEWVRKLIPPYTLIRQPAKVLCLMPSLLAIGSALAWNALLQMFPRRIWRIAVPLLLIIILYIDYARKVHPSISILENNQNAYATVAEDAAAAGCRPRALAIPLWPGDSHYSSIYQYFAMLHHVRMINGYNPYVRQGYFENVFLPFFSANQGSLTDEQVIALQKMGIQYLILHEDLFPEKVSPFPVTTTLQRFLQHPQLDFLAQDGSVWAFKIRSTPRAAADLTTVWQPFFPARYFEFEKSHLIQGQTQAEPEASGQAYARLNTTNALAQTPPEKMVGGNSLQWLIRLRGKGVLKSETRSEEQLLSELQLPVNSENWIWSSLPVRDYEGLEAITLILQLMEGWVDLDLGLLTAGNWPLLEINDTINLPAPLFFHAGHINLSNNSVVLRHGYDRKGIVLYGPKLPLPRGFYQVEVNFSSSAKAGTTLGRFHLEQQTADGEKTSVPLFDLTTGQPASGCWRQELNLPFNLTFVNFDQADLEIQMVKITRLE